MRVWLVGVVLGLVLAIVSVEVSLIGMVLAIAAVVALGFLVPPRFALLSGGLIGIGGLWLAGTLASLPCEGTVEACGNPYPMTAVTAGLVLVGVIAGLATASARLRPTR